MNISIVSILLLLPLISADSDTASAPVAPAGTILRTTRQQLLATLPPGPAAIAPVPFLSSPSGKYTAYLLRTTTAPGAGGFGNDFCFIQIKDTETEAPVWESECTPISTSNACSLVFADEGLAIFDGSQSQWDMGAQSADNNPLESVELVDEGDLRVRDKIGELAWRASEHPRVNQRCGELGSPGLGPALPPFAQPIGGRQSNMPFGQEQPQGGGGVGQTFGFADESGSSSSSTATITGVVAALVVVVGCVFKIGFVF